MVDIKKDYDEVGVFARAIVAKRLAVVAAVTGVLNFALFEGWISVDLSNHAMSWLTIGLNVVGFAVGALWSRDGVTPADPALNPTSTAGEALAPVSGTAPRASRPVPEAASIATDAAAALTAPTAS